MLLNLSPSSFVFVFISELKAYKYIIISEYNVSYILYFPEGPWSFDDCKDKIYFRIITHTLNKYEEVIIKNKFFLKKIFTLTGDFFNKI